MKNLFIILLLTCVTLSVAEAKKTKSDSNTPQKSTEPDLAKAAVPDLNGPNTIQQQREQQIGRTSDHQYTKANQAAAQQRGTHIKERTRQYREFETQLVNEYQKHNRRIAVLNRIRQLAEEKNLAETIGRVDVLVKMENGRHMKKIHQLHQKPANIAAKPETGASKDTEPNK